MKQDLDRVLNDALRSAADGFVPADYARAREAFVSRRRRRRLGLAVGSLGLAGAAGLATFVAVALLAPEPPSDRTQVAARPLVVTDTISVDDAPTGLSPDGGSVWVANAGGASVSRIDPTTGEVVATVPVGGSPDDVVIEGGYAWAADAERGKLIPIHEPTNRAVGRGIDVGSKGHLDMAAGEGSVWVASVDSGIVYQIEAATGKIVRELGFEGAQLDVAVGEGSVWAIDGRAGILWRIAEDAETGAFDVADRFDLPEAVARNMDMAVGGGAVWVAVGNAGIVLRVDPVTGEVTNRTEEGGTYAGIAVGEGAVWVLAGDGEAGTGDLFRLDPSDGALIGEPLRVEGDPSDVAVRFGAAWVTQNATDAVARVEPGGRPAPEPTTEEDRPPPFAAADVVLAYSAGGDIYVELADGSSVRLTAGRETDVNPTFAPDMSQLVFQRGDQGDRRIVAFDLRTREVTDLGAGDWPAFAPDGRLAYVSGNVGDDPRIVIVSDRGTSEFSAIPGKVQEGSPWDIRQIAWSSDGDALYYLGGWEGFSLYQAILEGDDPQPFDLGAAVGYERPGGNVDYIAPTLASEASVFVVRRCCSDSLYDLPEESAEIGRIVFTEGGSDYETIMPLDKGRVDLPFEGRVSWAGAVALDADEGTWRSSREPAWLVSTERDAWLIRGDDYTEVSGVLENGALGGFAINPQRVE